MNVLTKDFWLSDSRKWMLLIGILYGGGIIAHLNPFLLKLSLQITDLLLLLTNGLVLYVLFKTIKTHFPNKINAALGICLLLAIGTFLIEVLGVASGKVFGAYEYGETMKLQLWGVPLVIGLNWVVLMLAAYDIAQQYFPKIFTPLLAALMVVGFDWVMEPVAIHLNYWHWFDKAIPLQNYVAWLVIALFASSLFHLLKIKPNCPLLRFYFLVQLLFFILLRVLL